MRNENVKNIINEIIEKTKDCKVGFLAPEECKIKISELENFDFLLVSEIEKIEKVLWTSESNYFNKKQTITVPVLKIDKEYITFYPSVIKEFQKEINQ